MLTVCTKGLRVTQFQFSVCMYCTCGRIDNKTYLLDFVWAYCFFFNVFVKKIVLDQFSLSTNLATLFCACIVVVFCVFFGKKINILDQFSQSTNLATFFVWT